MHHSHTTPYLLRPFVPLPALLDNEEDLNLLAGSQPALLDN